MCFCLYYVFCTGTMLLGTIQFPLELCHFCDGTISLGPLTFLWRYAVFVIALSRFTFSVNICFWYYSAQRYVIFLEICHLFLMLYHFCAGDMSIFILHHNFCAGTMTLDDILFFFPCAIFTGAMPLLCW